MWGEPMSNALKIREDVSVEELRRLARKEPSRRTAMRMLAIANALDGMSRAKAAQVVGMERQALRDAVVRYNAEGIAGLYDRPKPGRACYLSEGQQAALKALVLRGPDPREGRHFPLHHRRHLPLGRGAVRRALCRAADGAAAEAPGAVAPEAAAGAPQDRPGRPGAVQKGGLKRALWEAKLAHPGKRLQLWFQDEARFGNKGRVTHRWYERGQRPPGLCDRRFTWAYIYAAIRPAIRVLLGLEQTDKRPRQPPLAHELSMAAASHFIGRPV